jgi:hypothetical protein
VCPCTAQLIQLRLTASIETLADNIPCSRRLSPVLKRNIRNNPRHHLATKLGAHYYIHWTLELTRSISIYNTVQGYEAGKDGDLNFGARPLNSRGSGSISLLGCMYAQYYALLFHFKHNLPSAYLPLFFPFSLSFFILILLAAPWLVNGMNLRTR